MTDQTGAIVPDAKVVLSVMGARLAIPVNDKGVYSVIGLYPGTYTLTVSAPNFADVVFDNITLTPRPKVDAGRHPGARERKTGGRGRRGAQRNKPPLLRALGKLPETRARSAGW